MLKIVLGAALLCVLVGCSSSSPAVTSTPSDAGGGGGGGGGATTQVNGTADGNSWQGTSAKLTASKLGNAITRINIFTTDACSDTAGSYLQVLLPSSPETGTFTATETGTPPTAIFYVASTNNTVEELTTAGSITVTSVSATEIDGSIDITVTGDGIHKAGSLQGTFGATTCGS